jgi:DNA repair photolyase
MAYTYPVQLTQQFRFCGNAFRIDLYRGCNFGCNYCFANNRGGGIQRGYDCAEFEQIENMFYKAFESGKEYKDVIIELLKRKVPLHLGGMSDPFQEREFELGLTYKLLELTKKYSYPMIISTKQANLPDKYWQVMDNKIHAFQISLMGMDEEFLNKYEGNTPSAQERIAFMQKLHDNGFWVSMRLQPLIDLEQGKKVVLAVNDIVNYITIEHLKIPNDNLAIKKLFEPIVKKEDYYYPSSMRNMELKKEIKEYNFNEIKKITKVKLGAGDNDLHYLSDSRNCCGIDTIGKEFDNWLKYNYTYFVTAKEEEKFDDLWCPEGNVNSFLNPDTRIKGFNKYKQYVDSYYERFSLKMKKYEDKRTK